MDGTLLNSMGEISDTNLNAIKRAIDMGVEFAIVTGRPYISVKKILDANKLSCFVIGCNGAQVTDKDGKLVKAHYINEESVSKIIKKADDINIYYQLYNDFYIYTKSRLKLVGMLKNYSKKSIKRHISIRRMLKGMKRLFFTEVKVKRDLLKFASGKGKKFYKIQIASLNQDRLNKMKDELKSIPDIIVTSSAYYNMEIGPKGVTKGTAVKELAQMYNIPKEDIIAMGDNFNDISMIEYAGCGVAMENAESAVKDKANFQTKSNDDNGVAFAIEKLVLGQRE